MKFLEWIVNLASLSQLISVMMLGMRGPGITYLNRDLKYSIEDNMTKGYFLLEPELGSEMSNIGRVLSKEIHP